MTKSHGNRGLELLGQSKFLRLVRHDGWSFVQRTNNVQVVGIVAVTDDNGLLLVEQYRPPVATQVIALPAGLAGDTADSHESLQTAAERELLEETGFEADSWENLATVTSSAGLTDETVALFRAHGLRRVGGGGGVDNEQIQVHEIHVDAIDSWLRQQAQQGKLIDGRVYAALYWISR